MKKIQLPVCAALIFTLWLTGCTQSTHNAGASDPTSSGQSEIADSTTGQSITDGTVAETTTASDTTPEATTTTIAVSTTTAAPTTRKPTSTVKPTTTRTVTTTTQADPQEWQGTWDIDAIIADAKAYAESLGMIWDITRTKDNSTWRDGVGTKPYRYDKKPVEELQKSLHERIYNESRDRRKIYLLVEKSPWYPNDYSIIPLSG